MRDEQARREARSDPTSGSDDGPSASAGSNEPTSKAEVEDKRSLGTCSCIYAASSKLFTSRHGRKGQNQGREKLHARCEVKAWLAYGPMARE